MLRDIEGLTTSPVAILLLILVAAAYVIIIVTRHARYARLIATGVDPEFIALLNDRYAFCDSDEEYKVLLEREANEPPPPVEY